MSYCLVAIRFLGKLAFLPTDISRNIYAESFGNTFMAKGVKNED
jgi:hypothetical protein